jgi:hypothetical protein
MSGDSACAVLNRPHSWPAHSGNVFELDYHPSLVASRLESAALPLTSFAVL